MWSGPTSIELACKLTTTTTTDISDLKSLAFFVKGAQVSTEHTIFLVQVNNFVILGLMIAMQFRLTFHTATLHRSVLYLPFNHHFMLTY